jgi:phosphoenolpyruvate carboxykinase (GTP)
MAELIKLDVDGWKKEIADVRENHYAKFGDRLPKELYAQLDMMEKGLNA